MHTISRSATAVLSLALLTAGCDVRVGENGVSVDVARGKAVEEWKRSYSLTPGGRVEIINVNGLIEAFAASGTEVEVIATREARANSDEAAQALLAKSQLVEDSGPDHIKIELKTEGETGMSGMRGRSQVNVRYRVNLPPGLNVSLKAENGAIRLDSVDGHITASTTNGQVTGRGLSGSVEAATVNGGISIGFAVVKGDSRIVTVNGPAAVALPPDANAQLDASAVNGGVSVEDGFALTASDRSPRRIVGQLNAGGPTIVVQTTNGSVRIRSTNSPEEDFGRGRRGRGAADE